MKKGSKPRELDIRVPSHFRGPLEKLLEVVAPAAGRLGLSSYLVGGAVRDLLEARPFSGEWDIVVFGGGDEGARSLAADVARAIGSREPITFPRFGTCLVPGQDITLEFAQAHLRTSLKALSSDPLRADALSRDFTVNALYVGLSRQGDGSPSEMRVLDPTGRGIGDAGQGVLRTPISSHRTIGDDPLRIFRAARLRAQLAYRIAPPFGKAARRMSGLTAGLAPERVFEEMNRILKTPKPSRGLEVLGRWSAFEGLMPEIQAMVGFRQENPYHYPDLFRHTLRVVDRCPDRLALRWAALLHDCGKPETRVAGEEADSYHGHESRGADLAAGLLERLKAGRKLKRDIVSLVRLHMVHYRDEWSDRAVRRLILRAGENLEDLLDLVQADSASLRRRKDKLRDLDRLRDRAAKFAGEMPQPRSPLSGREIMDLLGMQPGPDVGRAKRALIEAVVHGDIPSEEGPAREFLLKRRRKE